MKTILLKLSVLVAYIAMVAVNFLANSLPINNRTTGAISDAYPNLFAPAGLTFAIWGLIYLLLAGYVGYQFINRDNKPEEILNKINPLFIATCLANISWIFAWHYDYIGLSVLIISIMLFLLIWIALILSMHQFTSSDKFFIRLPFSVYFGWITVAVIANITVFLVSIDWNGFGIADFIWTSIILIIGAVIGILWILKDRNIAYGLTLIWAYTGILYKHLSADGFNREYPSVIVTVIVCLAIFAFFAIRILFITKLPEPENTDGA